MAFRRSPKHIQAEPGRATRIIVMTTSFERKGTRSSEEHSRPGEAKLNATLETGFVTEFRVNQQFGKCKGVFV
jgi:hypothetical protein